MVFILVTKVTKEKLHSTRQRWNPKVVEVVPVYINESEFKGRLAELGKLLYDEFCQRLNSQSPSLGMIPKRTGTDE